MSVSECEVFLSGDDYEGDWPAFYCTDEVKARKPHRCFECGRTIERGSRYLRISGKWSESINRFCFCLVCVEIEDALSVGNSREFGTLWDQLEPQLAEVPSPRHCLAKLKTPEAKAYLSQKWLEARAEAAS